MIQHKDIKKKVKGEIIMTQPQVKPKARIAIHPGMTVETVKKNGSEGQKLMAPLFDIDKNGKYDDSEAMNFDSYTFKTEPGKITMCNDGCVGPEIIELKYDNFEKDVLCKHKDTVLNDVDSFRFVNDKGEKCYFAHIGDFEKIAIDMIKGKVHVEGGGKEASGLYGDNIELTVKDSDLKKIDISGSKVNLQNVKDEGLLWDSATKITTDGNTIIEADSASKFEVSEEE